MRQLDFLEPPKTAMPAVPAAEARPVPLRLCDVLARIREHSKRPRMTYHLLTLLASLTKADGRTGAFVRVPDGPAIPVREHLAQLLLELTRIDPESARETRLREKRLEQGPAKSDADMLASRMTIVSRAMNDLERAGLVTINYEGYRVDSTKPGAARVADYRIKPELRAIMRTPPIGRA